ncbi:reductase [Longimycelium tulufanense]|uniref:Reductase n=1 Tax=Longimycelium tulufanense TaxID=907463 RepID=A0A8J3CAA0_9PSEU|nr:NAD-dependent epimerase/dehydratase family protein [Longimycelium tulufanense]GGM63933.1 reductase [Longimycelium tulufanense]
MRMLILGGSWFLGRAVAEQARDDGWTVATFRRGRTGEQPPGTVLITGDRNNLTDLDRAAAGPWDAVVDTSGYIPANVLDVARALEPVADRYVFVSTVSVYRGWPVEPLDEDSPILDTPHDAGPDYGYDGDPRPSRYGYGKAGCERAVRWIFGPGRTVILRPGVILGPREYVGRTAWWLRRLARGGTVLAPGDPDRRIQPIDVRDTARFAIQAAVPGGPTGTFNLVGDGHETFGDLLAAAARATRSAARLVWAADEVLLRHRVRHWTELPLWRPYPGTWAVGSRRARLAGLTTRSITDTMRDTWDWMTTGATPVQHGRAAELGITPEREAQILAAIDGKDQPVMASH